MPIRVQIAAAIIACGVAGHAAAQSRLPTIPPEQYTDQQKQAAADFLATRRVPVFGPFEPLMYSPEVMSQARAMGDYLRYKSGIGNTLSELVILVTARAWTQDYEWYVHAPIAATRCRKTGFGCRGSRRPGSPPKRSPPSATVSGPRA